MYGLQKGVKSLTPFTSAQFGAHIFLVDILNLYPKRASS